MTNSYNEKEESFPSSLSFTKVSALNFKDIEQRMVLTVTPELTVIVGN